MSEPAVFLIVLFGIVAAVVLVAALVSARAREWLKPKENKSDEKVHKVLEAVGIYELLIGGGGVVAAVNYVYRAWRTSPEGSLERLGWTLAMAATAAAVIWLIVVVIDRRINRSPKAMPDYSKIETDKALES